MQLSQPASYPKVCSPATVADEVGGVHLVTSLGVIDLE